MAEFICSEAVESGGEDSEDYWELGEETTQPRNLLNRRRNRRSVLELESKSEGDILSEEEVPVVFSTPNRKKKKVQEKSTSKKSKKRARPLPSGEEQPLSILSSSPSSTPLSSSSSQANGAEILEELRKNNGLLTNIVERVTKSEKRLKSLERDRKVSASGPGSTPKRKRDVPDEIRVSQWGVQHCKNDKTAPL